MGRRRGRSAAPLRRRTRQVLPSLRPGRRHLRGEVLCRRISDRAAGRRRCGAERRGRPKTALRSEGERLISPELTTMPRGRKALELKEARATVSPSRINRPLPAIRPRYCMIELTCMATRLMRRGDRLRGPRRVRRRRRRFRSGPSNADRRWGGETSATYARSALASVCASALSFRRAARAGRLSRKGRDRRRDRRLCRLRLARFLVAAPLGLGHFLLLLAASGAATPHHASPAVTRPCRGGRRTTWRRILHD